MPRKNNKIKISPWDASEYLESQEDIDVYLESVLESGDAEQIIDAFNDAAKAQKE
ncbi:MAG: hypothetical protein FWD90_00635 [Defluviitaleaceae bacterium]|nr:hypothetical protein [Defluviitaleaceae bacterium]